MKKNTDHIEPFRVTEGELASNKSFGMNGAFHIPLLRMPLTIATCIVSNGDTGDEKMGSSGWEHVSVRVAVKRGGKFQAGRIPEWVEMCVIKEIFWEEDEEVMQLHPKKADFINMHPHVLHLWRPIVLTIPMPPKILV